MSTFIRRLGQAALGIALVAASPTTTAAAAHRQPAGLPSQPIFIVTIGQCPQGQLPVANSTVDVTWKDSAGNLKAKFSTQSDLNANWETPDPKCAGRALAVGDRLKAHITDPSEMTRTFKVGNISVAFDRGSNVVSGVAPTLSVHISIYQDRLFEDDRVLKCTTQVSTDSQNHYTFDTDAGCVSYDAAGGDYAQVDGHGNFGDTIRIIGRAPYLQANLGPAAVDGTAKPFQSVAVTAKENGDVIGSAHKQANGSGRFSMKVKHNGSQIAFLPGDVVRGDWGAGQGTYTVRDLGLVVDTIANTVFGGCDPNTRYVLVVEYNGGRSFVEGDVTDGAGGTDTIDTDDAGHDLNTGDKITFVCARKNGDRTRDVTFIG